MNELINRSVSLSGSLSFFTSCRVVSSATSFWATIIFSSFCPSAQDKEPKAKTKAKRHMLIFNFFIIRSPFSELTITPSSGTKKLRVGSVRNFFPNGAGFPRERRFHSLPDGSAFPVLIDMCSQFILFQRSRSPYNLSHQPLSS